MKLRSLALAITLAALIALMLAGTAASQSGGTGNNVTLTANMTGETQNPPGDPAGSGEATIVLDFAEEEICYLLTSRDIAEPDDAHIHVAATGDIVADLDEPDPNVAGDCENIDRSLARDIAQNSSDYMVNVHNDPFSSGAIGGLLGGAAQ